MAGEFTRRNFVTVVEFEDFLKLELDQVLDLFSASDLAVPSEESIFDACLKWIKFDPAKRERFVVDLLEKVRDMSSVFRKKKKVDGFVNR